MSKQSKLKRRKLEEQSQIQELQQILRKTKKKHRNPYKDLDAICSGVPYHEIENKSAGLYRVFQIFDREIRRGVKNPQNFKPTRRILYSLLRYWIKRLGNKTWEDVKIIEGLIHVAGCYNLRIRDLETWKTKTNNSSKLFFALVRHLFAKYPVPQFLDQVWFEENGTSIHWFLDIAQGKNIRKCDKLPISLTKKMAHHVMQAPPHYSLVKAFRRGQVIGLGGDKKLAKHIISSRLGDDASQDEFWKTIIQFFINHPPASYRQVSTLIDYIQSQKFGFYRVVNQEMGYHVISVPAENPDFNIQGRTLQSLQRALEERVNTSGDLVVRWKPFAIPDFEHREGNEFGEVSIYRITQLLSNDQIEREGATMRHCVSTYITDCIEGKTSIWSMTIERKGKKPKRLVTIELNDEMEVRQALRKCNQDPKKEELAILKKWAKANKINIPNDLNE